LYPLRIAVGRSLGADRFFPQVRFDTGRGSDGLREDCILPLS
jgi:hypothetical protein